MATKKKTTSKKAPAKKTTPKRASKGKRYTDDEKSEVLAFVEEQGRGGQSKAAAKFGISALTISNWRKKAGKGKTRAAKAATPRKRSAKGGGAWEAMVALKADIDIMERKLAAKKAEFGMLAKKL